MKRCFGSAQHDWLRSKNQGKKLLIGAYLLLKEFFGTCSGFRTLFDRLRVTALIGMTY